NGFSMTDGVNITCINNLAYNNLLNGLRLFSSDDSKVESNNAHHNGEDGIRILTNAVRNVITGNT
ncbi:unnamed protein product, partial [marine sediment metagenome]